MPIAKATVIARSAAIGVRKPTAWKEQHHYDEAARKLAVLLGWEGPDDAEKNEIRVADAIVYLRRILHEIHVDAVRGPVQGQPVVTNEQVVDYLALKDPDEISAVNSALDAARTAEKEAAKQ